MTLLLVLAVILVGGGGYYGYRGGFYGNGAMGLIVLALALVIIVSLFGNGRFY